MQPLAPEMILVGPPVTPVQRKRPSAIDLAGASATAWAGQVTAMPGSIAVPSLFLRHATRDCRWVSLESSNVAHKIGYARVSTTDQDPQLQLDALAAEDCLKTYTATATGTRADRPEWNKCLADLRPGDTLIIWKIDRLGRNLRDLIEIVTTLEARGVGVKSLTNGIVDTTTAHGKLVFGIFALMAEYEAALI
jgi:Resolvase, N terminal domain